MRLIDADVLLEKMKTRRNYIGRSSDPVCLVEDAPIVNTVPVKHGRWIGYPECLGYENAYCDEHIVCSECKEVWNIIDNCAETFDYCPHCGAKMDGERRETND